MASICCAKPERDMKSSAAMKMKRSDIIISTVRVLLGVLLVSSLSPAASGSDTLNSSGSLTIKQTLISGGGRFELGFFSTPSGWGNATKLYLGIWYHKIPGKTYVWVANRDEPLWDDSAVLRFGNRDNIVIAEKNGSRVIWSSEPVKAINPVAQLLDNGNFVIREFSDSDPANFLWQSFDHPTDTLLPGQKISSSLKSGVNGRYLNSWMYPNNPSRGNYSFKMEARGDPELFLYRGLQRIYRSGAWVGLRFSGVPEMKDESTLNFTFASTQDEVYYKFEVVDPSIRSRLVVTQTGMVNRYTWVSETEGWHVFWFAPKDQCDNYMECGAYGVCNAGALFVCDCMPGFKPRNERAWALRDGSDGCKRKTELGCDGSDGFRVTREVKLPDSGNAVVNKAAGLDECRRMCLDNCNCTAYADALVVGGVGSGCLMFTADLLDIRSYGEGGQNLYVRLAAADPNLTRPLSISLGSDAASKSTMYIIIICVSVGGSILLLVGIAGCVIWKRKKRGCVIWKRKKKGTIELRVSRPGTERSQNIMLTVSSKRDSQNIELPLYDFDTVAIATDHFSLENKLGQGGFGIVYKGIFGDGIQVAVKRLSRESGQGDEEFKNEVNLIAKLQHRNLVRLLGCCVERREKLLIYEYLPNRSLDSFIFDKERRHLLNWSTRFSIICGIARGLVYLHQDSRFRIVHRDMKASNILLDTDMNPKISDFGMARIFGGDETEANSTTRVVGTYGYMSPEYAMDGIFSVKSDVFSFGVLILEIVAGKRNRGFYNTDHELNLLGYACKLWREGKGSELLCPSINHSYSAAEVLRCIHVGLLCVQERADDRPTMPTVVLLLSTESASLPQPKTPGFCLGWNPIETTSEYELCTVNQLTVTTVQPR